MHPSASTRTRKLSRKLVNDMLLTIDSPRYDGRTIVASLEDGLAYPNPNQDFHNSTVRRRDRDTCTSLEDDRICPSPCSATRWANRMREDGGVFLTYIVMWGVYQPRPTACEGASTDDTTVRTV